MPGKVIAVMAKAGVRVAKGTPLLVLEAMKIVITSYSIHYTKLYEPNLPLKGDYAKRDFLV